MDVVAFQADHLMAMKLQEAQAYCSAHITHQHASSLEGKYSFTGMLDGKPVIVAGLTEIWTHRALVWSFISRDITECFFSMNRAVKAFLDIQPYRRIEAEVDCEFEAGHRWVKHLGFTLEAKRMKSFRIDGGDSALYARVKSTAS